MSLTKLEKSFSSNTNKKILINNIYNSFDISNFHTDLSTVNSTKNDISILVDKYVNMWIKLKRLRMGEALDPISTLETYNSLFVSKFNTKIQNKLKIPDFENPIKANKNKPVDEWTQEDYENCDAQVSEETISSPFIDFENTNRNHSIITNGIPWWEKQLHNRNFDKDLHVSGTQQEELENVQIKRFPKFKIRK